MGDYREIYNNTKCSLLDNKGVALVTTIMIVAAILIISGAMLYLVTRGTRSSGEFQRFASVEAAADGGTEVATYVLENFENVFYSLKQQNPGFYGSDNVTINWGADEITFNRVEGCSIANDNASQEGVYLDRYLIGLDPTNMGDSEYNSCQEAVWNTPFITIKPIDAGEAPYDRIDIYIRKEYYRPKPGTGGSASLTAPSSASGGLGTTDYLVSIRSFATHYRTHDNSSALMLYNLVK